MSVASIRVPLAEATATLSQLVDRVCNGEEVTITRQEEAVARLVPIERTEPKDVRGAISELKRLRAQSKVTVSEIIEWKNEGRR